MKGAQMGSRRHGSLALIKSVAYVTAGIFILRGCISLGAPVELEKLLKRLGEDGDFIRGALSFELDASEWDAESVSAASTAVSASSAPVYAYADFDPSGEAGDAAGSDMAQTPSAQTLEGGQGGAQPAGNTVTLRSEDDGMPFGDIYMVNQTSKTPDFDEVMAMAPAMTASGTGPQVLIIHTHGSEAYTPADGDIYTPTDTNRTEDANYNVLRVGREVAAVLEENGIACIQSEELHDYPSYAGSYGRSLETVEAYLAEYPSIKVVLDIHRDALEDEEGEMLATAAETADGARCAQMLVIAGTDDSGLEHPNWAENLAFGVRLQEALDKAYPTLARPLNLRASRFNQHLSSGSLLIEIGAAGNTLQEALECARRFATVLAGVI